LTDDRYSPFQGKHPEPPAPELIETCWRIIGVSNRPIMCGVYRTAAYLEVYCHYGESTDALIRSERAADIDIARDIAAAWKEAAIDKGFQQLP